MQCSLYAGDETEHGWSRARSRSVAARFLWLLFLWWILAEGAASSWTFGIPTVLIATAISQWLSPSFTWAWRLTGFLGFIPIFASWSLRGGVDVASRALRPRLPLSPDIIDYPLYLPTGPARVFFVNVVSLLPGTLSADIRGNTLKVHVLDKRLPVVGQLERVESAVARLFDLSMDLASDERTTK